MNSSNEFDPHTFASYDALPSDKKKDFVAIPGGGFVRREAINHSKPRSLRNIFLGKDAVDPISLMHEVALRENRGKDWDELIYSRDDERIEQAWREYEINKQRVEAGSFPVKNGDIVFRVVGGIKIGGEKKPNQGDYLTGLYATPHREAVEAMLLYNDDQHQYIDGALFDSHQSIAIVRVDSFEIPKPDISHNTFSDRDQILVTGEVLEVLAPQDFFKKYE